MFPRGLGTVDETRDLASGHIRHDERDVTGGREPVGESRMSPEGVRRQVEPNPVRSSARSVLRHVRREREAGALEARAGRPGSA